MQTAKWDFQIAQPEQEGDEWRIGYTLISPIAGVPSERIAIDERFHSAHGAIAEATRLAQIERRSADVRTSERFRGAVRQGPAVLGSPAQTSKRSHAIVSRVAATRYVCAFYDRPFSGPAPVRCWLV